MKHSEQRVGIFFDVANLYYSARSEYNSRVNFGKVLEAAVAGRRLIRAIAYAAKTDEPEEQNFFEALNKFGIEVYTKDLQTFYDGSKKGNIDMELAIDALKLAPKLDVVVLVSGDGDYKILLEHLRTLGCRVEVIGFGRSVSSRLMEVAHDFINLEDDIAKYLFKIKDKKRTRTSAAASSSKPATTKKPTATRSSSRRAAPAKPATRQVASAKNNEVSAEKTSAQQTTTLSSTAAKTTSASARIAQRIKRVDEEMRSYMEMEKDGVNKIKKSS